MTQSTQASNPSQGAPGGGGGYSIMSKQPQDRSRNAGLQTKMISFLSPSPNQAQQSTTNNSEHDINGNNIKHQLLFYANPTPRIQKQNRQTEKI